MKLYQVRLYKEDDSFFFTGHAESNQTITEELLTVNWENDLVCLIAANRPIYKVCTCSPSILEFNNQLTEYLNRI